MDPFSHFALSSRSSTPCLGGMVDRLTPQQRSSLMSRIRGKDTKPELAVRRMLHAMVYRFRLHRRDLPGTPDIVLPGQGKIIFVHGCFWHGHPGCPASRAPSSRPEFWGPKLAANRLRDRRKVRDLQKLGWSVSVIWECQVRYPNLLRRKLRRLLRHRKSEARTLPSATSLGTAPPYRSKTEP